LLDLDDGGGVASTTGLMALAAPRRGPLAVQIGPWAVHPGRLKRVVGD